MTVNTNWWNRVRYTAYAPFYDLVVRRLAKGRRRSIELANVQPGERVLIVGCGTGLDLALLPKEAQVTAVDLTPAMVEKTSARAKALGMNVDARVMDAARLTFADGSFDVVLLHLILAVVPDPCSTAKEAARVLRKSGRGAIFDKFAAGRVSVFRRLVNLVTNLVATDVTRRLEDILADTGLEIVRDEPSIFGGVFRVSGVRRP